MMGQPRVRSFLLALLVIVGTLFFMPLSRAVDLPRTTLVEHESRWRPDRSRSSLRTVAYRPHQREQPFFNRLPPGEVVTGSHAEGYDISTKNNTFVGWFGIVRRIDGWWSKPWGRLALRHPRQWQH